MTASRLAFGSLLGATFLVYAANFLVQPVLPLLVLDLGGDATMVGVIVAAFSFPSLLLRPWFGRIADERSTHGSWWVGAALVAAAKLLYLVPSLVAVFAVRVLNGIGWAAFNTGGHTTLAKSAAPERRGRASSIYNLVIGLAQVAMPGLGLLLLTWSGDFVLPFAIAGGAALAGFALIRFGPVPVVPPAGAGRPTRSALLERRALLPMAIEALFSSSVPLYFAFLPVFALDRGIPLEQLALFYPIYGLVFVGARIATAPFADRLGRRLLLAVSVASAAVGLALGLIAADLPGIVASGALYALGSSLATPAAMALAIDRSDPSRTGAAMATYSLGYQLALGVGAAAFGLSIDRFGFPAPFAIALGTQAVLAVILVAQWRSLPGGRRTTTAAT